MAHGDAREAKWRGKMRIERVASSLALYVGTRSIQSLSADPHSSTDSSRLNWHPRRFKWTRPFRWKTKSGFCAWAITFRTCYTNRYYSVLLQSKYSYTWIKRDQLDVTCFIISLFNAQHVSNVNTSILRSLRLICWVISWVVLFWCLSLHTDTTPPQPNHNVTPTHIEPEQYNPWNNSTKKSQAPEDGCINIRNKLSIE